MDRREFLSTAGITSLGLALALSGCTTEQESSEVMAVANVDFSIAQNLEDLNDLIVSEVFDKLVPLTITSQNGIEHKLYFALDESSGISSLTLSQGLIEIIKNIGSNSITYEVSADGRYKNHHAVIFTGGRIFNLPLADSGSTGLGYHFANGFNYNFDETYEEASEIFKRFGSTTAFINMNETNPVDNPNIEAETRERFYSGFFASTLVNEVLNIFSAYPTVHPSLEEIPRDLALYSKIISEAEGVFVGSIMSGLWISKAQYPGYSKDALFNVAQLHINQFNLLDDFYTNNFYGLAIKYRIDFEDFKQRYGIDLLNHYAYPYTQEEIDAYFELILNMYNQTNGKPVVWSD
ncbi:hypothetical protein KC669_00905 [Candidatus Dojkabacteria bacterium]|uniref:Uncharacterized protein n=1 Tax=Candidatus Dojkabacteria bacterium TaxID=2099670 RepID=A0A955L9E3_9BACT|nr:hypothetical protein [Candidatus Dojkabacteria bacterium]